MTMTSPSWLSNSPDPFAALAQPSPPSRTHRCSATNECTDPSLQLELTTMPPTHMPSLSLTRSTEQFSCCENNRKHFTSINVEQQLITNQITSSRGSWLLNRRAHYECARRKGFPCLEKSCELATRTCFVGH